MNYGHQRSELQPERLIATLWRLHAVCGRAPAQTDWNSWPEKPCNVKTAMARFGGTWRAYLKAAGMDPDSDRTSGPPRYEDEYLLSLLREFATRTGETPSQAQWTAAHPGGPSERAYRDRWGTWLNAIDAAGLPPRSPSMGQKGVRLRRNRQMVTGGRRDVGVVHWDPNADVEQIRHG